MRRLVNGLLMASVLGILFMPLLNHLAWLDRGILGVAVLMVYLVARFWGSLLPYLAEASIACDSRAGMRTSMLYLANILGSAAGSVVTGFVLMDYLGPVAMLATLVMAGIVTIMLLIAMLDIPVRENARARPSQRYSGLWQRSQFQVCRAMCSKTCNGRERPTPSTSPRSWKIAAASSL